MSQPLDEILRLLAHKSIFELESDRTALNNAAEAIKHRRKGIAQPMVVILSGPHTDPIAEMVWEIEHHLLRLREAHRTIQDMFDELKLQLVREGDSE